MTETKKVAAQYGTDTHLRTRISIHDKYSVNKQGFGSWIYEKYQIRPGDRILELGCGDGSMWLGRTLPEGAELLLTDISEGMLRSARETLSGVPGIRFAQLDIQEILHPDEAFDLVIANMMLYHVSDLAKALTEVRWVLKPGGCFYCATYGENGITEYVQALLARHGYPTVREKGLFTLQNGGALLEAHFPTVQRYDYEDSLAVTDTADLVAYVSSLRGIVDYPGLTAEVLYEILDAQKTDGIIHVPKEYGIFISVK